MNMADKFQMLEDKVGKVLQKVEALTGENKTLKSDNAQLESELTGLKQEFKQFRLQQNDQAEAVKSKLASLLGRIEELEKIGL